MLMLIKMGLTSRAWMSTQTRHRKLKALCVYLGTAYIKILFLKDVLLDVVALASNPNT